MPRPRFEDLIYRRTGVRLGRRPGRASDEQEIFASLLAAMAWADGEITTEEALHMVEAVKRHFDLNEPEAVSLVRRAADGFREAGGLDELMTELESSMSLAQKEALTVMLLEIVAADGHKAAEEIELLQQIVEAMRVPEDVLGRAFERYFADRRDGDAGE